MIKFLILILILISINCSHKELKTISFQNYYEFESDLIKKTILYSDCRIHNIDYEVFLKEDLFEIFETNKNLIHILDLKIKYKRYKYGAMFPIGSAEHSCYYYEGTGLFKKEMKD